MAKQTPNKTGVVTVTRCDNHGTDEVPWGYVYFSDGLRCLFCSHRPIVGDDLSHPLVEGVSGNTGAWPPVDDRHQQLARDYLRHMLGEKWYIEGIS